MSSSAAPPPPPRKTQLLDEYKRSKRFVRDIVTEMLRNKDNQLVRSMVSSTRHRQILESRIQKLGISLMDARETATLARAETTEYGQTVDLLNKVLLHHSYGQPINKDLQGELMHRTHIVINSGDSHADELHKLSTDLVHLQTELEASRRHETLLEQDVAALRHALELVLTKAENTLEQKGKQAVEELVTEANQDLRRIHELEGDPHLMRLAEERQRQLAEMSAVRKEIEKLQQDKKTMETALRKAEQEVVQMRLKMMERDSSMAVVSKKIKAVESKLMEEQSTSGGRIEAAERLAGELTQKYEAELKKSRDALEDAQKKLGEQNKMVDYYKSQVSEAKYEFVRVKKALEKERIDVQTELTAKLNEERERAAAVVKKAEADVKALMDKAAVAENTLFKRQSEFANAQQQLADAEQRLATVTHELQVRDEELTAARKSVMSGDKDAHQTASLLRTAYDRIAELEAERALMQREHEAQREALEGDLHGVQSRMEQVLQQQRRENDAAQQRAAAAGAGGAATPAPLGKKKPLKSPASPSLKSPVPARSALDVSLSPPAGGNGGATGGSSGTAHSGLGAAFPPNDLFAPPALVIDEGHRDDGAHTPDLQLPAGAPIERVPTPPLTPKARDLLDGSAAFGDNVVLEVESRRSLSAVEDGLGRLVQRMSRLTSWRLADARARSQSVALLVDAAVNAVGNAIIAVSELGAELRRKEVKLQPAPNTLSNAPKLPVVDPAEQAILVEPSRTPVTQTPVSQDVDHHHRAVTPAASASRAPTPAASASSVVGTSPAATSLVAPLAPTEVALPVTPFASPPAEEAPSTPLATNVLADSLRELSSASSSARSCTSEPARAAPVAATASQQTMETRVSPSTAKPPPLEKKVSLVQMELDSRVAVEAHVAQQPAAARKPRGDAGKKRKTEPPILKPSVPTSRHGSGSDSRPIEHPAADSLSSFELVEQHSVATSSAPRAEMGCNTETPMPRLDQVSQTSRVATPKEPQRAPIPSSADASTQVDPPPRQVDHSTQADLAPSAAANAAARATAAVAATATASRRQNQPLPRAAANPLPITPAHGHTAVSSDTPSTSPASVPEPRDAASLRGAASTTETPAPIVATVVAAEVSGRDFATREKKMTAMKQLASNLGVSERLVVAASNIAVSSPAARSARRDPQTEAELQLLVLVSSIEKSERVAIVVSAEQTLWEIASAFRTTLLEIESRDADAKFATLAATGEGHQNSAVKAFILARGKAEEDRVRTHRRELLSLRTALAMLRTASEGADGEQVSANFLNEMSALQGQVDRMLQQVGVEAEAAAPVVPAQRFNAVVSEFKKLSHAFESAKVVEKMHAAMHESTRARLEETLAELQLLKSKTAAGAGGGSTSDGGGQLAPTFERASVLPFLPHHLASAVAPTSVQLSLPANDASHSGGPSEPAPASGGQHETLKRMTEHVSALYRTIGAFVLAAGKLTDADVAPPQAPAGPDAADSAAIEQVNERFRTLLTKLRRKSRKPTATEAPKLPVAATGEERQVSPVEDAKPSTPLPEGRRATLPSVSERGSARRTPSTPQLQRPPSSRGDAVPSTDFDSSAASSSTASLLSTARGEAARPSRRDAEVDVQADLVVDHAILASLSEENADVREHLAKLLSTLDAKERALSGFQIAEQSSKRLPRMEMAPRGDGWGADASIEDGLAPMVAEVRRRLQRLKLEALLDETLREGVAVALDAQVEMPARASTATELVASTRSGALKSVIGHVSRDIAHSESEAEFLRTMFASFPQAYVEQLASGFDPDVTYDAVHHLSLWWDRWVERSAEAQRSLAANRREGLQHILRLCDMLENITAMVNVEYGHMLAAADTNRAGQQASGAALLETASYLQHRGRVHHANLLRQAGPPRRGGGAQSPAAAGTGSGDVFQLRSRCTVRDAPSLDPAIKRRVDEKLSSLRQFDQRNGDSRVRFPSAALHGELQGESPMTPPPVQVAPRSLGPPIPTVATMTPQPGRRKLGAHLFDERDDGWKSSTMPLPSLSTRGIGSRKM